MAFKEILLTGAMAAGGVYAADAMYDTNPAQAGAAVCTYDTTPEGPWGFTEATGLKFQVVLDYNKGKKADTVEELFAQPSFEYPCATGTTPDAAPTTTVAAGATALNSCVYTVIKGDNPTTIRNKTGSSVSAIATEMGVSKNKVTMLGAKIDTCVGNGIHDEKQSSPANAGTAAAPVTVVSKGEADCNAKSNWPKDIVDLGSYTVEPMSSANGKLKVLVDKSKQKITLRLSMAGIVDYDYNKATGVCAKDEKESGNHDILYNGNVAINDARTPTGTFSLGAPYNTTCYTKTCLLKDFQSLWGTDTLTGKKLNGNTGVHLIPRDVPADMTWQEAMPIIDSLAPVHSEEALAYAQSSKCLRVTEVVKKVLNLRHKDTTFTIQQ